MKYAAFRCDTAEVENGLYTGLVKKTDAFHIQIGAELTAGIRKFPCVFYNHLQATVNRAFKTTF